MSLGAVSWGRSRMIVSKLKACCLEEERKAGRAFFEVSKADVFS